LRSVLIALLALITFFLPNQFPERPNSLFVCRAITRLRIGGVDPQRQRRAIVVVEIMYIEGAYSHVFTKDEQINGEQERRATSRTDGE